MRLIDADALYASLAELYERFGCEAREVHFSLLDMKMNIEVEETIDAEPVVRCKDCIHKETLHQGTFGDILGYDGECNIVRMLIRDNCYCSWGERREDE